MLMPSLSRLASAVCCAALVACSATAPPAAAGPSDDELGELAEPLQTRVTTEFLDTPIDRVGEYIERESPLVVTVNSFQGGVPINMKFEDATVREVLDRIALTTELDWIIRDGVVFIGSDEQIRDLRVVGAVIDIRGLLIQVPNYTGPRLGLDGALSNTNSGGSNAYQAESRSRGGGGGLFGSDNDIVDDVPSRGEVIDQIVELIQDTTGEPEWWLDEAFTLRELNGQLVIRATPEVIEDIQTLLNDLGKTLGKMVAIEGQWFVVPRELLDGLDGGFVMDGDAYAALREQMDAGDTRRIGVARTVCYNGQRVYVYAGNDSTFLSDVEPIPDTGSVDPTLSTLKNGASLDIESTISLNNRSIALSVRSDVVVAIAGETVTIPIVGVGGAALPINAGGSITGTVDPPADSDQEEGQRLRGNVGGNGELMLPGAPGPVGTVTLDKPSQDIVNVRTNVRIPDGGAVVLSGATGLIEGIDTDRFEVVLILRAHILEDEEADDE